MVSLLGRVRLDSASVFLRLVLPASVGLLSVCLHSVPLSCLLLGCYVCLFLPVGSFSVVLCLVQGFFLLGHFLFLLVRVAFAIFGSSLLSSRCSCLRSLLPFSSRFLCCSLHLLPSVGGSLSPFLGRSSSLSPCFRLRLLRSVASGLGLPSVVGSLVGSCPFPECLPSAVKCFFIAFLPSGCLPSRTLFPLLLCLSFSSLRVSCFPLFPLFSVGLFFSSFVCSLVWSVSPSGFYFPCSFQVPRSSSSRFLSAFSYWCLHFRPYPGGPLSRVLPLPVWFVSFGRCPVLFLLWCFLSLPCVPGFLRIACVFFPSASSIFASLLGVLVGILPGLFFVSCLSLPFFSC